MSEPEIDRRCSVCGAAVRSRAAFCPQCGQSITPETKNTDPKNEPPKVTPARSAEIAQTIDISRHQVPDLSQTQPLVPRQAKEPKSQPVQHQGLHRATDVAREKVDKIRKASSVVIDQAAYDPSLRFLLVAAVLFILFLFLLLMSKVLG
jgi:hypothetical protein